MKSLRLSLLAGAALMALAAGSAWSHHGRGHHNHGARIHFGFVFGPPVVRYYAPPPYYYPRHVVVPAPVVAAPTYIERADEADPPQGYWHYCRGEDAYYPYVKHCAGGWERVPARPAP